MSIEVLTYEKDGVILEYQILTEGVAITGYKGMRSELHIPAQIDHCPVTAIQKKAFFNADGLCRVFIPDTVSVIGDWAFSHCRDLEEVFLKRKAYEFGRSVFLECDSLKRICVLEMGEDEMPKDQERFVLGFGALLAATCGILDAPYLFDTDIKDDVRWLSLWDAKMFSILREDDMEGYTQVLLCGEEDYGSKENSLDFFLSEKRKRKVRLAFLRLLFPIGLQPSDELELKQYLLNHTMGCESAETWLVLKEEHAYDTDYITLFLETGCVSLENFDDLLFDLSSEYPQLKTYLMRYKEETLGGSDFFAGLDLSL